MMHGQKNIKLASNEIFSPSNKIHRKVGRAKDLSAPRYLIFQQRHCENLKCCKISSVINVKPFFFFLINMYDIASKINLHVLRYCCKVPVYFVEQYVVLNYV
jgi:hypothetical protein